MDFIIRKIHNAGIFGWLYLMAFLFSFQYSGVLFINSSMLEQYLSKSDIGILFSIGSALTLILLSTEVIFLKNFGIYQTTLMAFFVNFASLIGIAFTKNTGLLFVFFTLFSIANTIIFFCFDVFLENSTTNEEKTGSIRGFLLSLITLAGLFSPLISGYFIGENSIYRNAYLISALYLLPVFVILPHYFRNFKDPKYTPLSFLRMLSTLHDKDIFHISSAQFLLRFYFSWMMIYLPIHLHKIIGFSWPEIGIILFIMLIPYVFIEYPAGIIADKWLGEKELLVLGFVITSIATFSLFFVTAKSILLWGFVLLATRTGTAFIESMSETYFFKQIDGDDVNILSVFRMLRPLSYILGPLFASAFLVYTDIQHLWIILSAIMLVGIFNSMSITDTK